MNRLREFWSREDGPAAVEYAVLLAGIILFCISALTMVGGSTANYWSNNQHQMESALSGS
jgi:pilus assembly protein Flp/PilA